VLRPQHAHISAWRGEDISAGEVLGQYLGEMEHVRIATADRPRNNGYRLVMKTRPERPSRPVLVAINAERMGGLMRFVNHSCKPVATFMEVAAGRRTTVVVVTTEKVRRGQEVTVDYGDDLWFICRCQREGCVHRRLQHLQDP
jgi:SET domain-containing protein